jgi:integrase
MEHISPAYVQKQLGHSSIQITVDTYCHWIPGEGRGRVDQALEPVRNADKIAYLPHIKKGRAVTP